MRNDRLSVTWSAYVAGLKIMWMLSMSLDVWFWTDGNNGQSDWRIASWETVQTQLDSIIEVINLSNINLSDCWRRWRND